MEELQDAIEDAQYVNAIATQEDGPRPVLPWEKPTAEQLASWEKAVFEYYERNVANNRKKGISYKVASRGRNMSMSSNISFSNNEGSDPEDEQHFDDEHDKNDVNEDDNKDDAKDNDDDNKDNDDCRINHEDSKSIEIIDNDRSNSKGASKATSSPDSSVSSLPAAVSSISISAGVVPGTGVPSSINAAATGENGAAIAACPATPFTMDWTLQSPIGFFLFSAFVKEVFQDYCRINFCEDVLRFKKLRERPRLEKGREIIDLYVRGINAPVDSASTTGQGGTDQQQEQQPEQISNKQFAPEEETFKEKDELGGEGDSPEQKRKRKIATRVRLAERKWKMPPQTEIEEYDLDRPIPEIRMKLVQAQLDAMYKLNMEYPECSECCIGIKGIVRQEILAKIEEVTEMSSTMRKAESSRSALRSPSDLYKNASGPLVEASKRTAAEAAARASFGNETVSSFDNDSVMRVSAITYEGSGLTSRATSVTQPSTPPKTSLKELSPVSKDKRREGATSLTQLNASSHHTSGAKSRASARFLSSDIFDRAEVLVMESLRRDYWDLFLQSEYNVKLKNFLWFQDRRVVPEDFFVMRVLGRGGFGLVTACKKGTSGKLYAMKVMNKKRIKIRKSEQLALNERKALAAVESNFVVNLKYSFHSKEDVFLILDLMTGGDLGYHLHQRRSGCFPKRECQYYAARIMLGLQALHDKRYVYRDLKPENCLLAEDGRVKITDLGLATKITPTLHGAAGTRGYWAPEMLRRDQKGKRMPYGHTVDWFSFGCCLAEFISGTNPFRSEKALNFGLERGKQTKEKAIDCATLEMEPEFSPELFEPDAINLCRRLLDKNEKTRLGYNGCEEIMAHPWFKNVNWEAIISDRKRPPFVPPKDVNAASQSEIGNFAEDKTYQETVLTEADDEIYKNWDWTNPRAFAAEVIEFLIYERETGEPLVPSSHDGSCCCAIL